MTTTAKTTKATKETEEPRPPSTYAVETAYGHWFRWAAQYREPLTAEEQTDLDAQIAAALTPPETPVLLALVPDQATLGTPSFTLAVQGEGFAPSSVILWNGSEETTIYVSPTELRTDVNMATAEAAVTIPVQVRTGALLSNELPFTLVAGPPARRGR